MSCGLLELAFPPCSDAISALVPDVQVLQDSLVAQSLAQVDEAAACVVAEENSEVS